jgi:hypothetical protein
VRDGSNVGDEAEPWYRGWTEGQVSLFVGRVAPEVMSAGSGPARRAHRSVAFTLARMPLNPLITANLVLNSALLARRHHVDDGEHGV